MKSLFRFIIWVILIFGGIGLSVYLDHYVFYIQDTDNNWLHYLIGGFGSMLFVMALVFIRNTGQTLAKYGRKSPTLPRMQTDQLTTVGMYSLMRHPMNQTLMMLPMAIGIMLVSPSFVFIIAPLEIMAMYIMILLIEEPKTKRKFGQAYVDYCAKTPRFCFKWECMIALNHNPYDKK